MGAGLALAAALAVALPGRAAGQAEGPAGADPLVYVAMGDSFTSGPLVLPHDTTFVPQDCGQSARNYPHLAALLLGATLRDVSCGSAEIEDLFEPQENLPVGGVNPPQAHVLGPDVDVVTVSIGGNDVGFVGVALDCIRFGTSPPLGAPPCHPQLVVDGVDTVMADIAAMQAELTPALVEVQRRAPNAEVFVVSYPTSLPDSGAACWPYVPILPEDMPHLVRWFKAMNAALAAAAADAGATYVDIYTTSIGHDACQLPGVAWVNGLVVVPPSYPAHPNDLSFLGSAPVVAAAIRAELAEAGDEPTLVPPAGAEASPAPSAPVPPVAAAGAGTARRTLPATGGSDAAAAAGLVAGTVAGAGLALRRRSA